MTREEMKDLQQILRDFRMIEEPEDIKSILKLSRELDELIFLYQEAKNM
ncbi:hypothetical protein [Clostridium formicaceticum]|nr:hypothetical protein [Clostridium formicaceticum]